MLLSCWKRLTGCLNFDLWVIQQHVGCLNRDAQCRIVKTATGLISCTTSWLFELCEQSDLYQRFVTHLEGASVKLPVKFLTRWWDELIDNIGQVGSVCCHRDPVVSWTNTDVLYGLITTVDSIIIHEQSIDLTELFKLILQSQCNKLVSKLMLISF